MVTPHFKCLYLMLQKKKSPFRDKGHLLVIIRETDNFKYPGIKMANGGSYEAEITERI